MAGKSSKRARSGKAAASTSAPPPPSVHNYKDGSFLWFESEADLARYLEKFENREILPPRLSTTRYFSNSAPLSMRRILVQGELLEYIYLQTTYIHPHLIRAFYSNLKKDEDGELITSVNGVNISLSEENISILTGLPRAGDDIVHYAGAEGVLFNEQAFFQQIGIGAFTPSAEHRRPTISRMLPEYRLIFYLITRILKPRKFNHTTLSHEDVKLMHAIIHNARINWCKLMMTHMYDAIGDERPLPYALSVMSLFENLDIKTDVGPRKNCTKHWEIQETSFHASGEQSATPPLPKRSSRASSVVNLQSIAEQIAALSTTLTRIDSNVARTERNVQNLGRELHGYFDFVHYPYAQATAGFPGESSGTQYGELGMENVGKVPKTNVDGDDDDGDDDDDDDDDDDATASNGDDDSS